jgi:hypothetical protein
MSTTRQRGIDGPVRCHYADDPAIRPDCSLTATVRYGDLALCPSCRSRRSTVGKGEIARPLPAGPAVDVLSWIDQAHRQAAAAEHTLDAAIVRARQAGVSWAQIGDRLGVSRQAAQQRLARSAPLPPRASVHESTKKITRAH